MIEPYPSDPPEWYVGSTNKKGFHSSGRILAVPPAIAERVTMIVQGNKFPIFRTFNDVFRDSIAREIKWLDTIEPGIWSERMRFYELGILLENDAKERKEVEKFIGILYDEPDRQRGVKMAREALGMLHEKHHAGILRYLDRWEQ